MSEASGGVLKAVFVACFAILVALVILYGIVFLFFVGIGGTDKFGVWILIAMVASLFLYFRWPWVAALVSWAELAREFHAAMPWERHSLGFVSVLGVALIVVAHTGLMLQLFVHRRNRYAPQ